MSIFQDRQNQNCLLFVSFFCILLMGLAVLSGQIQLRYTTQILLKNEGAFVSSLLEQGVSKETLAAAFSGETVTEEAALFLRQIGHRESVSPWILPSVRQTAWQIMTFSMMAVLILGAFLWFGAVCWMKRREELYEKAADRIENFAAGDFSGHLPGNQAGTLYRLFASVDQMALALQTKSEAERRAKEFLKDMVSDISHQLKTPLSALNMYTEIINGEPDRPEVVRQFSEKSMQSLSRMEELIQSLLKVVRLDAGSIHFEKHWYPVTELVERALENLRFRAEQEQKPLLLEGDKDAQIFCDMEWTGEALGNLVKNALDHTREGECIRIFWESSPAMIRLTVADEGCGIAPEDIHHIFKRFYRSSRSGDRQGAGLGLPLAKGIVEGQGGILSVLSIPGKGAKFCISLLTES